MSSLIKPYINLCRVSNLPTVWTNVLAAIVLSGAGFAWHDFIPLAVSMSLFYSGGMCMNDIMDLQRDRTEKPFRPLPSGSVSVRHATVMTGVLFAGALLLLSLSRHASSLPAGLVLLGLIVSYNLFHNRRYQSVLLMGACRLMVFLVSSMAVAGTVSAYVITAGLVQFAYTVIISIVARFERAQPGELTFPVIPLMISCMSLVDGILLSFFSSFAWLAAGIGGALLTFFSQRYVKGD